MSGKIRIIWSLMAGQRLRYSAAIAALVIASCFLYLAPLVPQIVIDGVISPSADEMAGLTAAAVEWLGGRELIADRLWIPGLVIAALTAIAGLFTYLRGKWSADASESIARKVRDMVYDHLQRLPTRYFDTAETGDLLQRSTSDVETLRLFLERQVVEIGRAIIMLVVPIPLMLAIDAPMTIVSVVLIPFIVAFSLLFFLKVKANFKLTDEAEGRMTTTIQENLTGIRVVRAFARGDYERIKFETKNDDHRTCDYRVYRLMAIYWATSDLLCFSQRALVVGVGAYWMATQRLEPGAYYYFIAAVSMFIWPVRMMGRIMADLGKAVVALDRLTEILSAPLENHADVPRPKMPRLRGDIEFDGVSFSHGEQAPVLTGVSFAISAGETLALLGPSGCGKSTIVNLLLRLYDHDAGAIRIDGHEVHDLDRYDLRSQMAVVMQEPFLYSKSLRENVKIGRPDAGDDEMIEATTVACVHDSIAKFENEYGTLIGERGITLSGGQRQRVAIARAILPDPAILILDDALSAVDTETESLILGALRRRRGRSTTILIAHRLSTVMAADRIIVLDHGRMVQSGTHERLVNEAGLYQRLWMIQTAEEADGMNVSAAASGDDETGGGGDVDSYLEAEAPS